MSKESMAYKCLFPLLDGMNYVDSNEKVMLSLAQDPELMTVDGLIETMANLSYKSYYLKNISEKNLDREPMPLLFVHKDKFRLLLSYDKKESLIYNPEKEVFEQCPIKHLKGAAYGFAYAGHQSDSLQAQQNNWFVKMISRFKKPFFQVVTLTLLMTLLDLMIPLFVVLIYGQIGSNGTLYDLLVLLAGIILYFTASLTFSYYRGTIVNYISTRLGYIISSQTYRRLLYLSPNYTETASISAQVNRIKDFENLRRFTNSGIFTNLIESSFSLIYIIAIFIVGRWLGMVPLITAIIVIGLGFVFRPFHKVYMEGTSSTGAIRQQNLLEVLMNASEIKSNGMTSHWTKRSNAINSAHIHNVYEQSNFVYRTNSLNYFITSASVLVVIYGGVLQVFDGRMSMGLLIGLMMLYWKVLASVRGAFSLSVQVNGLIKSIKQINRFMKLPLDNLMKQNAVPTKPISGHVRFQDVSIRYNSNAKPALIAVSFIAEPGQVLGITGHDGAGKSTILKLILGMYTPQGGRIILDGMNIRQLEPISLRQAVSYSSERDIIFEGTIRDNFKYVNPLVTDEMIETAAIKAFFYEYMKRFNMTLDTYLTDEMLEKLPASFSKTMSLARMLCREVKLYLIDEPENHLDRNELKRISKIIKELAVYEGATVIVATKNEFILEVCDKTISLNQGRMKRNKENKK